MTQPERDTNSDDVLIDEVRRIRRNICEEAGNDVDRLAKNLRQVEADYLARRGVFQDVSKDAAARVVESWGKEVMRHDDPIVDEVRALRRKLGSERTSGT